MEAYTKGIFPWYNETELPLWWSPDPRFVLFPQDLYISKSMAKLMRKSPFQFSFDKAFEEVISTCAKIERKGQDGTW
ncbi:leucyl/phenylalanyl-tRNA--protein transferase, partial [Bradyrhizobium sp. IC3195]|uniref:leucyl/phenylalanyl-tRNA--protein transferase n=1 Tax=Bradyrhizobium sp. IC3195 TaxID=2793804 RepID=UPI003211ACFE